MDTFKLYRNAFEAKPVITDDTFYYNSRYRTYISGRILENSSLLTVSECNVTLYEAKSMIPVSTMTTYDRGCFRFLNIRPELEYMVLAKDRSRLGYNAVVLDRVKPVFYTYIDETYPSLAAKPIREPIVYPEIVVNEERPQDFLENTFGFNLNGLYNTKRQGTWTSLNLDIKESTLGITATFNQTTSSVVSTTSVDSLVFNGNFTLDFFVNVLAAPASTSTGSCIICNNKATADNSTFSIRITPETKIGLYQNQTLLLSIPDILVLGTWYQVTITREDNVRLSVFLNGIKKVHIDFSGTIDFGSAGTVFGNTPFSPSQPTFNGILKTFKTYNKNIFSRDFGTTQELSDMLLFNENLKVALMFEGRIADIASGLPVINTNVIISEDDYDSGNMSAYFDGTANLVINNNEYFDFNTSDFTVEFAFKPTSSALDYTVLDFSTPTQDDFIVKVVDGKIAFKFLENLVISSSVVSLTSFNKIRISRKNRVVGLFLNDVLEYKQEYPSFNEVRSLTIGSTHESTEHFIGYFDTFKVFTNYVNYDFFEFIPPDRSYWSEYEVANFPFTTTYLSENTYQDWTATSGLNMVTNKCVSPPNSLYKVGSRGLYSGWATVYTNKPTTVEGWFCLGPSRSGAYYTLFDNSHTSYSLNNRSQFIAVRSSDLKLVLHKGTSLLGSSSSVQYTVLHDTPIPINEWFHFAFERDVYNDCVRFFLNFEEIYVSTSKDFFAQASTFRIGFTDTNTTDYGFPGWIDEVYIYRGLLKYTDLNYTQLKWHPWRTTRDIHHSYFLNEDLQVSDTGTITWLDAYRSYNVSQTDVTKTPVLLEDNGLKLLTFNQNSQLVYNASNGADLSSANIYKTLMVIKFDSIENENPAITNLMCRSASDNIPAKQICLGDGVNVENNNLLVIKGRRRTSEAFQTYTTDFRVETNKWYLIDVTFNHGSRLIIVRVNGVEVQRFTNAFLNTNAGTFTLTNIHIGATSIVPTAVSFQGQLSSMFFTHANHSSNDLPRMEHYLLNEVGAADLLPVDHMYRFKTNTVIPVDL